MFCYYFCNRYAILVPFNRYAVEGESDGESEGEHEGDWKICRAKQTKIKLITQSTVKFDI